MNDWFTLYFGVGAVATVTTMLWRLCRPSGKHDSSFIWTIFSAEWIGGLLIIAAWPLVVPYVIWSYRRWRNTPEFIRDDEEWPPKSENKGA